MKLYIVEGSNNCRKVQAVIAHLGLAVESVRLDLKAGEVRGAAYRAINPNGKVPALVDGDRVLWESNAIMVHLAEGTPGGTALWPAAGADRIEVLRWLLWEGAHYNRWVGSFVYENVLKGVLGLGPPDPAPLAEAAQQFHRFAGVLDGHLADGRPFLVGEQVTLADFAVGSFSAWLAAGRVPVADHPHVAAWYRRLETVPAWAATLPPQARAGD